MSSAGAQLKSEGDIHQQSSKNQEECTNDEISIQMRLVTRVVCIQEFLMGVDMILNVNREFTKPVQCYTGMVHRMGK